MQVQAAKKLCPKFAFVFYDIETRQDDRFGQKEGVFAHTPNLLVSQVCCDQCISSTQINPDCQGCGGRGKVFEDPEPVLQFLKYIKTLADDGFKDIICVAHNAKSFDNQFVLKTMLEKTAWKPELLMNGSKIVSMSYGGLRFIDSINFIPMSLAKLPAALGLDNELTKGFFPHLFNTSANSSYEGALPDVCFYGADSMSSSVRDNFIRWHKELKDKGYVFKMRDEIRSYCKKDVEILRQACLKFRDMFLSTTGVDPFREALTIASACMKVFRKNFLKPDTIAIMPSKGYRWADVQSFKAVLWILYEERKRDIIISHAGNGREKKILGHKVDGFYEDGENRIIFEFHGCYYHGCQQCYPRSEEKDGNRDRKTLDSRFESTERKVLLFRENGYEVVEMWECKFRREMEKENETYQELLKSPILKKAPLNPRDAFFGGRTNAVKLYKKVDDSVDEEIRYYDVCSLYPYVNKYKQYPEGHPKIYVGEECPPIEEIEGLIKCTILPPTSLYHPVLPVRVNKKLMFPLCMKCATEEIQGVCSHSERDRAITGTWVSAEVKMALSMGYNILEIHEAWHYSVNSYDPVKKDGGLFTEYINCFLKMKQEASGWPSWCDTEEKKTQYLKTFKEKENIELNRENVKENTGMRSLAKLMLNSFWGKFGQRENLPQCSVMKSGDELYKLLTSPSIEVSYILPVSEDTIYVNWTEHEDALTPKDARSVVVACYTTAHARLELYSYLKVLNERILYFDTDSIIFTQKPGEFCPKLGDFLGDMTDELVKFGAEAFVDEFVSGGPKNYALRVKTKNSDKRQTICKARGLSINSSNERLISFDTLKSMVLEESSPIVIHYNSRISRKRPFQVVTQPEHKTYQVVYTKRRRVENFDTLPYGFKRERQTIDGDDDFVVSVRAKRLRQ
ncbi:uncharacterized protein LOC124165837 [Ischnura elegans]|uniref:uncharacterized protein LOC124165837 n=1 Tax=Ischnura elegans TaxID=197161 RepID=UPI001ED8843B|nr:uncharacterized protein LOC124165837 [Ischnura elegans]